MVNFKKDPFSEKARKQLHGGKTPMEAIRSQKGIEKGKKLSTKYLP